MKVEDPNALRFILQDDLYLLEEDKRNYNNIPKPKPPIETPLPNFNYLGENKKNFLILTNYPDHEFIAADHLAALESVLGRIGYSTPDVAILNTAKTDTEYGLMRDRLSPRTLLILGAESMPAGMEPPQFNLRGNNEGLNILYTFSFGEMMTNIENKKAFWDQMKTL